MKPKILLIEDEHIMHFILRTMASQHKVFKNYEIVCVDSYPDAVDCILDWDSGSSPTFVVLDINLGNGFTGWDLLELPKLSLFWANTHVFVSSSSSSAVDKLRAFSYDCVLGYYEKPLSLATFDIIADSLKLC